MNKPLEPIKITDTAESREYTLEFNRRTVSKTEQAGFDLSKAESAPMTMVYLLFWGAFLMHHPHMTQEQTNKILDTEFGGVVGLSEITNEDGVTMLEYLGKLYGVPFGAHIDEENGANPPRKMTVKF